MIETYSRKKCVSPFKINSKCALVIFFIFSQNMLIWNKLSECVGEVQNLFTYNLHVYGIQHFEYTLTNLCGDISQCTKGVYSIQNFGYTSSIYGWYSIAVHKVCIACSKFWKHRLCVCIVISKIYPYTGFCVFDSKFWIHFEQVWVISKNVYKLW